MKRLLALLSLCLFVLSCEVQTVSRSEEKPTVIAPTSPPVAPPVVLPVAPPPKPTATKMLSPFIGDELAKVTIVVFTDYQCPYCAKAEITLQELQKQFGSELRIIWRDLPLESIHKSARPAAIAARAAAKQGNDKFYAMHTALFANQKVLPLDVSAYESYASAIPGLDVEQWKKDIVDPAITALVNTDLALAASLGVKSTPNFFINGELLKGAAAKDKFEEVIRRQIARADAVLASGVPLPGLYDSLVGGGKALVDSKAPTVGVIYQVPSGAVAP
jgi:protein-disulfide isomerase